MNGGEVVIGKMGRPHGIRGEIKVIPYTAWPDSVFQGTEILLKADGEKDRRITAEDVRKQGNAYIIQFAGIRTRDEAERMRGWLLVLPQASLPPLEPDTYFTDDLIGLTVFTTEGARIGMLEEVFDGGSHDIYVIRDKGKEMLVPAVKAFIKKVDLDSRAMTIEVIEGLLE